jgi:hypothetical protein
MLMRLSRPVFACLAAAAFATPVHAQQWGAPLFSSPFEPRSRFELLVSDANGAGTTASVAVRPFASAPDLRIRAGILDGYGSGPFDEPPAGLTRRREVGYVAGVDYIVPVAPSADGPLRAALVTGIGVGVNASTRISVPLGVTVGYDGGWIRPYVTPRLVLEHERPHEDNAPSTTRLLGAVDWGVDVDLPLGATLRAALTTGSFRGGGIGISF